MKRISIVMIAMSLTYLGQTPHASGTGSPVVDPLEQEVEAVVQNSKQPPRELGQVRWNRDYQQAVTSAADAKKPLLILFQEVPGCHTCVSYGETVLGHPLIVDAAEHCFVPTAVYNNVEGKDRQVLNQFGEKTWWNPVVRIVNAKSADLARVADDYSVGGLAAAMSSALEKEQRQVPTFLRLLVDETRAAGTQRETATFAMHCFWVGEAVFGRMDGVVKTRPGFLQKKEVVEVEYNPNVISYESLVKQARQMECASTVFARSDAQLRTAQALVGEQAVRTDESIRLDREPKYYLLQTVFRHVPMTELQAARINAALAPGQQGDTERAARQYLSPSQLQLLDFVRSHQTVKWPNWIGSVDLVKSWKTVRRVADSAASGSN